MLSLKTRLNYLENQEEVKERYNKLQLNRLGRLQGSTVEDLNNCNCIKCKSVKIPVQ